MSELPEDFMEGMPEDPVEAQAWVQDKMHQAMAMDTASANLPKRLGEVARAIADPATFTTRQQDENVGEWVARAISVAMAVNDLVIVPIEMLDGFANALSSIPKTLGELGRDADIPEMTEFALIFGPIMRMAGDPVRKAHERIDQLKAQYRPASTGAEVAKDS